MREIRMLRAMWRGLETEPRTTLHGHEGGNPGHSQGNVLTGHRASPRPDQALAIRAPKSTRGPLGPPDDVVEQSAVVSVAW